MTIANTPSANAFSRSAGRMSIRRPRPVFFAFSPLREVLSLHLHAELKAGRNKKIFGWSPISPTSSYPAVNEMLVRSTG
ncbi:MAG TPA: hypothetical protein VMW63_04140 [Methanoregulaceae archaeon]|nr:hypothetical protein [Methanoregulaceae archaeon]